MRYLLLIHGDSNYGQRADQAELDAMMKEYWEFTRSITDSGEFTPRWRPRRRSR